MKKYNLSDMKKGWFIGNFSPTIIQTNEVEVAVKEYISGDKEETHYHKIATELTVVILGNIKMNGNIYSAGDIVVVEPGESANFEALTDVTTAVIKFPGASNDKYFE